MGLCRHAGALSFADQRTIYPGTQQENRGNCHAGPEATSLKPLPKEEEAKRTNTTLGSGDASCFLAAPLLRLQRVQPTQTCREDKLHAQ